MAWTQTLNPSAVESKSAGWSPSVDATIVTNLSDANDATLVSRATYAETTMQLALSAPASPPVQRAATVTAKAKTGTTVTLTTSAAHSMTAGTRVLVAIGDADYDGTWTLTSASGTSLVYSTVLTGGTSGAASGTVTQYGEALAQVRPCYRAKSASGATDSKATSAIRLRNGPTGALGVEWRRSGMAGTPTTYEGPWVAYSPSGAAWTATLLGALSLVVADVNYTPSTGSAFKYVKAWVEAAYETIPIAQTLGPSGTIADSTQPVMTWTWTDGDAGAVTHAEVRVFDKPGSWTGFNPDTATPLASEVLVGASGSTVYLFGSAPDPVRTTWQVPVPLDDGVEHRFYTRVGKVLAGVTVWSAWSYTTGTIDMTPPPPPTCTTPTWNDALQAVTFTVYGHGNILSTETASVEGTAAGWAAITNCTVTATPIVYLNGTQGLAATVTTAGVATKAATVPRPAVAGVRYGASFNVRGSTSGPVTAALEFLNAAGTVLSSATSSLGALSTSWLAGTVYGVAPAGTATVRLAYTWTPLITPESLYTDKVKITPCETGYTVTWSDGVDGDHSLIVERSDDGGTTWAILSRPGYPTTAGLEFVGYGYGQTGIQIDPATGQLTVEDYEVPRAHPVPVQYRAILVTSGAAGMMQSDRSATVTVTTGSDNEWWIKCPQNPGLNLGSARVQTGLSEDLDEPAGIFATLGGTGYTVVSGGFLAYQGTFTIRSHGAAEWAALKAILEWPDPLLMQDVHNNQRWVRFTKRTIDWQGTRERPARSVAVAWVETAAP